MGQAKSRPRTLYEDPSSSTREPLLPAPTSSDEMGRSESIDSKQTSSIQHREEVSNGLKRHLRTPEERQLALAAALKQDPGVKHGSARSFAMYFIVLVACCCAGDTGFDGTVMGGINTMSQFQSYFHMNGASAGTGLIFGIYTLGSLAGTVPASFLPDQLGRRASMFIGNIVLIIGALVTALAKERGQFLAGRFITGMGGVCASASAKSFLTELAAPQHRGLYVGFLNSFFYVGQITATGMMVSTGKYKSDWSWRLPLFIQIVPAALNVMLVWFCPESPRWLHTKGRGEESRRILAKLHSSTGDVHSPLIDLEMDEIESQISVNGADKSIWDFRGLFRKAPGIRYRTAMVILIGTFGQLSGNGMVTYFLPNLLLIAGITNQNKRLTLNFVNSITSYMGALTGTAFVDRIGRRRLLLYATSTLVILLAIAAALLSDPSTSARSSAGIAMIYLFMVVFSFGWTPMQSLYPAEVLPYETRVKGLAFLNICTQASSCINTFGLPSAFGKLNWKVILIFLFWDVFEVIVIYFSVVETKGLTLEEIDEVFAQPSPRKYSVAHQFKKSMIQNAEITT